MTFEDWYAEILEWIEDFPEVTATEQYWRDAYDKGLSADKAWDDWWNM